MFEQGLTRNLRARKSKGRIFQDSKIHTDLIYHKKRQSIYNGGHVRGSARPLYPLSSRIRVWFIDKDDKREERRDLHTTFLSKKPEDGVLREGGP